MLGFPILYFKGMRILMFQLSGFNYRVLYLVRDLVRVVILIQLYPDWGAYDHHT